MISIFIRQANGKEMVRISFGNRICEGYRQWAMHRSCGDRRGRFRPLVSIITPNGLNAEANTLKLLPVKHEATAVKSLSKRLVQWTERPTQRQMPDEGSWRKLFGNQQPNLHHRSVG